MPSEQEQAKRWRILSAVKKEDDGYHRLLPKTLAAVPENKKLSEDELSALRTRLANGGIPAMMSYLKKYPDTYAVYNNKRKTLTEELIKEIKRGLKEGEDPKDVARSANPAAIALALSIKRPDGSYALSPKTIIDPDTHKQEAAVANAAYDNQGIAAALFVAAGFDPKMTRPEGPEIPGLPPPAQLDAFDCARMRGNEAIGAIIGDRGCNPLKPDMHGYSARYYYQWALSEAETWLSPKDTDVKLIDSSKIVNELRGRIAALDHSPLASLSQQESHLIPIIANLGSIASPLRVPTVMPSHRKSKPGITTCR